MTFSFRSVLVGISMVEVEVVSGWKKWQISLCITVKQKMHLNIYYKALHGKKNIRRIMWYYNVIWILMKCLCRRFQTPSAEALLCQGERLTNKASWRPFTLFLSFHLSTSLHSFSNAIIFDHTIQPSPLIGRYTVGSHGSLSSQSFLSLKIDRDGKMLSQVIRE